MILILYSRMYLLAFFSFTRSIKQAVAEGNTLFQFLKSFFSETTVGFAEYRRQLDNDNAMAPIAAAITNITQNILQKFIRFLVKFLDGQTNRRVPFKKMKFWGSKEQNSMYSSLF